MSVATATAKSGLQKEVVALYRRVLREVIKKDRSSTAVSYASRSICESNPGTAPDTPLIIDLLKDPECMTARARQEFRKQASQVSRKDFRTIEHKIRHGYKQIKLLQMPGVKKFSITTNT